MGIQWRRQINSRGLGLIECLKNYGWKFIKIFQEAVTKTIPQRKKWLSEEALQRAEKRRELKGKREK